MKIDNSGFWVTFVIYSVFYVYLLIHSLLEIENLSRVYRLLHPLTWCFFLLSPSVFLLIQSSISNPNSDLEDLKQAGIVDFESAETDFSAVSVEDLEGFAETKNNRDENIFEIYDRMSEKDIVTRKKTMTKEEVVRYFHPKAEVRTLRTNSPRADQDSQGHLPNTN
uniref:Uncharacterized protein n=1 Tax=Euplotes harpa TaxID=151035 RepID=A0A7S3J4R3_9SPIT|mmetsp:Transcript_19909/g.23076  ORF Transcript_19909/g.23076 Transcript_19909/m.23076 type:complete len:166 (+) Transcript_19909:446-943(+)